MKTKRQLTDEELLVKLENDEIEWTSHFDVNDTAEIRAYVLLRREWEDRLLNAVAVRRRHGATWAAIADGLDLTEEHALETYSGRIGDDAEREGRRAEPSNDAVIISAYVKFRDHAASKLDEAVARALKAGVPNDLIDREVTIDHYEL